MTYRYARRLLGASLLVAAFSVLALAQDAGQALALSVRFNSTRNSITMDAAKKAEVDRLAKLATDATGEKEYGDAMKYYFHGLAVMRGTEWNASRALSAGLTIKVSSAVIEPGDTSKVWVGELFALKDPDEKVDGKVKVNFALKTTGDELMKDLKTIESVDPDFIGHPLAADFTVPEVANGNYKLVVTVALAGQEPANKIIGVHLERGLRARVVAAKAQIDQAEHKLKAGSPLLGAIPTIRYRVGLYDMAAAGDVPAERIDFGAQLKDAGQLLDAVTAGKDPFAGRHGDFKKAYLSAVDNTLQPYRVFVPSGYDGSKAYPLIIALHGMGGDENSWFDQYANGAFKDEAEKRGYLVACPKGRQPASMYRGSAEQDVMDVLAQMRSAYKVDADRIYLTGHSMGGFGTWSVAMDHPEIFAALAPISGGGRPSDMAKIASIPQIVIHGDDDRTVPVQSSRTMVEAARKLNVEVKYIEVPKGSHVSVAVPAFKDIFDWFDTHHKKAAAEAKAARR